MAPQSTPLHRKSLQSAASLMAALLSICALLAAPSLAPIADLEALEDAGLLEVPLLLDPSPLTADQFQFSVTADNPELLSPENLSLVGDSPRPTLKIQTTPNASGTSLITVTAQTKDEPPVVLLQSFRLQVWAVDDPPRIEPIPNQVLTAGGPALRIPIVVSDPDSNVAVQANATDDLGILRVFQETFGAKRFLVLQASASRSELPGRTQVRITATANGKTAVVQFYLTIRRREFVLSEEQNAAAPWQSFYIGVFGEPSFAMTWVDVNRDGYPDVVVPGAAEVTLNPKRSISTTTVSIGRNTFQGFDSTTWMDIDGDGVPEVFAEGPGGIGVGSKPSNSESILLSSESLVSLNVAGATWADVNGDGQPDLIYSGTTNGIRRVVIATRAGGNLLTPAAIDLPEVAGPVVAADFDHDGRTDLLLCDSSQSAQAAQIYWNRMPAGFVPGPKVASDFPVTAAGFTDVDGDGVPDVWLVQRISEVPDKLELNVFLQRGPDFRRSFHLDAAEFVGAAAPAWGDFNHDGLPDFVAPRLAHILGANGMTIPTNYFVLYRNQGAGNFNPGEFLFGAPPTVPGRAPTFIPAAADIDLDGDLDLIGFQSRFRLFYNRQQEPNVPPESPTGLQAFVLGDELHLFWSPATDRNQTTPLTYNVRAGTRPGLGDLIPSQSLTNGLRQLVAPGNAGYLLSYSIHLPRLDLESIYWSVQAVDASFSGGPFATEQTLEMDFPGNLPPSMGAPERIDLVEDVPKTVRFTVTDDRTPPGELQLTVTTDSPEMFPGRALEIVKPQDDPSPAARNLALRPSTNRFGTATVFLVATDRNGASTTNAITVVVRPVVDAPAIRVVASEFAFRNTPLIGTVYVFDPDTPADDLKIRVSSSNPQLLPLSGIELSGKGDTRKLILTPAPDRSGEVTVTLNVEDGDGASGSYFLSVRWQDQLLVPHSLPPAMTNLVRARWVDFDGDGLLDVVGSDRSREGVIALWRQGPRDIFEKWSELDIGFTAETLLVADFDGDGDPDLVASRSPNAAAVAGPTIAVVWNDGGQLVRWDVLGSDTAPRFLVTLDLDSDGDMDLVSANGVSNLQVLRHAPGGFENTWTNLPVENPAALTGPQNDPGIITGLAALDYNGDGRADLFLSRNRLDPQGRGVLILQKPSGSFRVQQPPWNSSAQFVDSADFNNDGRPDFLIQDWASSGENPSKIIFSSSEHHPLQTKVTNANVGDLDGNGTEDALGSLEILTGLASGSAEALRQNGEFWGLDDPASGDFDQDGRLDLLGQRLDALTLLKNLGFSSNRPPEPPAQLRFEQLPLGIVHLSWSAGTDPDQSGGLTYNLRVGSTPGANDIVPSLSLPDGRGLVSARGNVGWSLEREVRNLTLGRTYYWSVQAVDSGRVRSPFAPEQSFVVTGTPVIAEIEEISVSPNTSQVEIPITVEDPETPPGELRIEVISLNSVLLPPSRIHLGGTPAQRLVILEPMPNRAGPATILIRATDGDGHVTERYFTFNVLSISGHSLETFSTVEMAAGGQVLLALNAFDPHGEFQDYQLTISPAHGTLEVHGSQAVYRPDAKFLGEDRLEFLAFAPGSLPAFGRVTLRVVPAHHLRPELRLIRAGFPQRLQIVLRSIANTKLTLETSTDLTNWTSLGDHAIPASELLVIDPPEFTADSPHFLRASLVE